MLSWGGVGDGNFLELLNKGASFGGLTGWRPGFIEDFALGMGKDAADAVDELEGVLVSPEVEVKGVKFVVIFGLVVGVIGWEVPFFLVIDLADDEGYEASVLVCVLEVDIVEVWQHAWLASAIIACATKPRYLTAIKCVLILCAWLVRNL